MDTLRPPAPHRGPPAPHREPPPATVALPAAPAAARLARAHLRALTGGVEDPRVAVVVSELVTNAVVHASSAPRLRALWEGTAVRIEVGDDGPGRPERPEPTGDPLPSGRGLALVEALSDAWGTEPAPEGRAGKVVWARVTPAAAPAR